MMRLSGDSVRNGNFFSTTTILEQADLTGNTSTFLSCSFLASFTHEVEVGELGGLSVSSQISTSRWRVRPRRRSNYSVEDHLADEQWVCHCCRSLNRCCRWIFYCRGVTVTTTASTWTVSGIIYTNPGGSDLSQRLLCAPVRLPESLIRTLGAVNISCIKSANFLHSRDFVLTSLVWKIWAENVFQDDAQLLVLVLNPWKRTSIKKADSKLRIGMNQKLYKGTTEDYIVLEINWRHIRRGGFSKSDRLRQQWVATHYHIHEAVTSPSPW